MLSRPEGLGERALLAELEEGWAIRTASASYLPLGAGSHHWWVEDIDARAWFVTVDDLNARRNDPTESRIAVFDRLAAALGVAHALSERGARFVAAPVPARAGEVLRVIGEEWAVAVYPMIDGETFRGGQCLPLSDRLEVVDLISRLHSVPLPPSLRPRSDDYRLQNRRDLEDAVRHPASDAGPYAEPLEQLLTEHRRLIVDMLGEYDALVASARGLSDRHVPTHGEPHAGNAMRTTRGWVLVDWDMALLAAPERDLWLLEPGDGVATAAYEAVTRVDVIPALLTLFRLRWDLADLGLDIARLRAPHATSADDNRSWDGIAHVLSRRATGDVVPHAAWR